MAAVTIPRRELTIADLHDFPDDGNRYELIQGSLHVNPAPNFRHQRAVFNLVDSLRRACPPDSEVFGSPFDVILGPATLVQPDVLVVRTHEIERLESRALPLLAVEVLSPSTHHYDRGSKRLAYHEAEITSYWIVDPEEPSITVLEWSSGDLLDERTVVGADTFRVEGPFPFTVRPVDLQAPARDA
jgi:Uma2 family endonuclease